MGKKHQLSTNKENKIIPITLDADFLFERAIRYLDRNNFPKALKYFWRIIDIEPNNPIHYCNLAGILSEMGHFEESNQLLIYVVEKLDPGLSECYYYLANNYVYLDELEKSLNYIHKYLDASPQGEYVEDANEMLTYISTEIDEIDYDVDDSEKELFIMHFKAKNLLEEGRFYEAIKNLKGVIEENPDFLAARNNLALAYFYIGNYIKATEQVKYVLDTDSTNIHALCNLAIFYRHLNQQEELNHLLELLRKITPFKIEYHSKLATTFAIIGEHDMAFSHFQKIINHDVLNPTLLHYGAVSAFNVGKHGIAYKWWNKIFKLDDNFQVVKFYLDTLPKILEEEPDYQLPILSYQYELPFERLINMLQLHPEQYKNKFTFNAFLWGLEHGDERTKEKVLLGLGYFKNLEAENTIRALLMESRNTYSLKKKALVALEEMNAKPPYIVTNNGKVYKLERQTPNLNLWKNNWLEVLVQIEKHMTEKYNLIELYDAKTLWFDFISKTYPDTPQVRKSEGWAAAIEFLVAKLHRLPVSIDKLAVRYEVSKPTIAKNINILEEILDVNKIISYDYQLKKN